MMSRPGLVCLFLLLTHFGFSQNFRKGYVRLKGGQDQAGLIGQLNSKIPETVEYKASDSSEVVLYKANEIDGYGINDGLYFTSFLNPGNNSDDWVFVELLVHGELTLIRRNNLYFVLPRGTNQFVHLSNKYRNALRSLMSNCPWVASKSSRAKLSKAGLTEFVKSYNECVATKNPNLDGMPRPVSVALVVGYDNSTATFSDKVPVPTRYLAAGPLRDKSFVQAGVDVTLKSHKVSNFVGLYAGMLYNSNRYQAVRKLTIGTVTQVDEYSIDYAQLKFPIGFEVSRPSRKRISLHARAGIVVPVMLTLRATHPYSEVNPNSLVTVYNQEPSNLTAFRNKVMFMGAFGFDYKASTQSKVRLQFAWSAGGVTATANTENNETSIHGKIMSLSVMAGFIF